ncbi:24558_t:CDS:1, partial [Racocetra persica]
SGFSDFRLFSFVFSSFGFFGFWLALVEWLTMSKITHCGRNQLWAKYFFSAYVYALSLLDNKY